MSGTTPDLTGARVVLIGTGTHAAGSGLSAVPAALETVQALAQALIADVGVDPSRISVLPDPPTQVEVGDVLKDACHHTGDVLLFYYVGHGLISEGGTLHLATKSTELESVEHRAVPYAMVRQYLLRYLRGGPSRSVVVILDCCYAGLAVGGLGELEDLAAIAGAFVVGASGRSQLALAPPGQPYTAFSGALLRLLSDGDPNLPSALTLNDVVTHLSRVLPEAGYPRPRSRAEGLAGTRVVALNRRGAPADEPIRDARPGLEPYRGLSRFEMKDAAWFFGREQLTASVVRQLRRAYDSGQPLIVMGPSGAGKSSLLRAGLLPALRHGELEIPGSAQWPQVVISAGAHPLVALAKELNVDVDGVPEAVERLRGDARGGRVVLVVDQFEDMFTVCTDPDERTAFLRVITATDSLLVVLNARSDAYSDCEKHQSLLPALREKVIVGALTIPEIHRAVCGPAELAGHTVQPALIDLLISELNPQSGATLEDAYPPDRLPLLSHALLATWDHRTGLELTTEAYRKAGRIGGALAQSAEEALGRLTPEHARLARSILIHLVHVGTTSDHIRTVSRQDLITEFGDEPAVQAVLNAFSAPDVRVLRVEDGMVQLTHETVLRSWSTLRTWLDVDRTDILLAQQAAAAAQRWATDGEDQSQLYRGPRLALAQTLLAGTVRQHMTPLTARFLTSAVTVERRARRRRRYLGAAAVVSAMVLVSILGILVVVANNGERQRRLNNAQHLISVATAHRGDDAAEALTSGLTALVIARDEHDTAIYDAARSNLITSLADTRYTGIVPADPSVIGFDAGSDGWVVSLRKDGEVSLWDAMSGAQIRLPDAGAVRYSAFVAKRLVTIAPQGQLVVWDLTDRRIPRRIGSADYHAAPPTASTTTPDGQTLILGTADGHLVTWDLHDPAHPVRAAVSPNPTSDDDKAVLDAVVPQPGIVVSASAQGITTWRMTSDRRLRRTGWHGMPSLPGPGTTTVDAILSPQQTFSTTLNMVRLAPNGRTAFLGGSVGSSASAIIASVPSGKAGPAVQRAKLTGHSGKVLGLAVDSAGQWVASAGVENTIRLWYLHTPTDPKLVAILPTGGRTVYGLTFAPRSSFLTAGLTDGSQLTYQVEGLAERFRTLAPDKRTDNFLWIDPDPHGTGSVAAPLPSRAAVADRHLGLFVSGNQVDLTTRIVRHADGKFEFERSEKQNAEWWISRYPDLHILSRQRNQPSVTALAISPERSLLALGSAVGVVSVWSITDPQHPRKLFDLPQPYPSAEVVRLRFAPRGETLAIGTDGSGAVLADLRDVTRPRMSRVLPVTGTVRALDFSPDGTLLAGGGGDGLVRFWSVSDPVAPRDLPIPAQLSGPGLLSLAYSPIATLMAVGTVDGGITLWDVSRPGAPSPLQPLYWAGVGALQLEFSPDGKYLAASDKKHTATYWYVDRANAAVTYPLSYACDVVDLFHADHPVCDRSAK